MLTMPVAAPNLELDEWSTTLAWFGQLPAAYPRLEVDRKPIWALGVKRAARHIGRPSPVDHVALLARLVAPGAPDGDAVNPLVATELLAGAEPLPTVLRDYLERLGRQIDGVPPEHVGYPTALLLRERLAAHGIGREPSCGDWLRWKAPSIDELWTADTRTLGAVAQWFVALLAAEPFRVARGTDDALAAIMISSCRRYELTLAAQLREALRGCAEKTDLCRTADRFFLLQHSRRGFFGHANPFTPLANKSAEWIDLEFRLPITVAVLGALRRDDDLEKN
jgi:hypothetical protein